jgi:hypothetical protein
VEDKAVTVADVIPELAKAALFGAKTVNGPGPLKVVAKLAFTTASFKTLKSAFLTTTSVIVLVVGAGVVSSLVHDEALIAMPIITAIKIRLVVLLIFMIDYFLSPYYKKVPASVEQLRKKNKKFMKWNLEFSLATDAQ